MCSLAISDDSGGTGIIDGMEQLFSPVNDIRWHRNSSNTPDSKVTDQVFRRAVKIDADPVTLFNAQT
jgi:hypothetical protein